MREDTPTAEQYTRHLKYSVILDHSLLAFAPFPEKWHLSSHASLIRQLIMLLFLPVSKTGTCEI